MRKIVFLMALLSSLAFANSELERQCNNGDTGSCVDLGILYFNGDSVKQDYKKANELFSKACEMNNAEGCAYLGILYYYGDGVKQDYKKAMELYNKACEMNNAWGCAYLGYLYDNGYGVRQNYKKARELYNKACEMNNAQGCNNLGILYYNGKGVKQDYKKAMKFVIKTCEIDTKICEDTIEELYIENSDYKNLMDIGNNLCEKDNALGCALLGGLYYNGFGVKQDYKRAIKFLNKACDLGLKDACKKF
ncbi:tetratricopeptide repeat protein [Helicobacter pullorum]|uniref:tetratricopeptide repeat protein n=1 Tax=Helicobacter pullorum TaxID=35818 RepID=UPI00106624D2|nr:tetratricopeptide repeat protein [Helicobacter pullorum]